MSDTSQAHENRNAKPDLGAAVSEIKTALTGKAEELAGRSTETGAAAVSALGKTAATLAGSLEEQSPAVADYVRSTGQRIDRLADDRAIRCVVIEATGVPVTAVRLAALATLSSHKNAPAMARPPAT